MCYTSNMDNTDIVPADDTEVNIDVPDSLKDETGEQALLSRIPHLEGGPRTASGKADYLGYRACGFGIRQALYLADITWPTLSRWRNSDATFKDIEENKLQELQDNVGPDLIRLGFTRNMRLAMATDFKILIKAVHHMDSLSDREFSYLKRMRGLYGSQELVSINRALAPESGDGTFDFAELVLSISKDHTQVGVRIGKNKSGTQQDSP